VILRLRDVKRTFVYSLKYCRRDNHLRIIGPIMADAIDMNEHREEQLVMVGGGSSSSIALQSVNNSNLRRRRLSLIGYSGEFSVTRQSSDIVTEQKRKVTAAGLTSYSPESWSNIQQVASIIVALNVTTLRALRDGWYGSPQIISRCCDRYERVLTEGEVELLDSTIDDGGVHFEDHVRKYVNDKNREEIMNCLVDTRTSKFYSQLVDIELKKYRAAKAHSVLVLKADNLTIPAAYGHCESYQSYVEYAVSDEQERRRFLKETLTRARRLLSAIKVAAKDGNLDDRVLEILKLKLLALQEHFEDATAAVSEKPYDLFDQARDDWW
jgi:hypothetical protein